MSFILVTGGCGYIGSHTLLEFLKNTNHHFLVIDNLSTGFIQNLEYLQNRFQNRITFFNYSLNNKEKLEQIFHTYSIECVLHFAASLSVEESTKIPLEYYKNNTINTTFLIELCTKYNIKNFIFSSTAAVYGQPEGEFESIDENFSLNPINPYGTSKMMSEFILKDSSKIYNFNYVILRYFNVAGANMDNDFLHSHALGQRSKNAIHLIKIALECAVGKREKMGIYGINYDTKDGTCIRDYIHINDLASAHLSAYQYLLQNKQSNIFNVGYSKGYSVKEVIDKVKEVTKQDFLVEILGNRAGDPAKLIADNRKILQYTNWQPKYNDLEKIIQSAYDFECYLRDVENE
ncbi:UDP-glucose 4-epimerase GalE [Helicobacter sp. faydin-H20]|uniref:UDP-glucose 4-epimerase GalE n=1 Tax=Helicobacter anatolicus TaxID=2905874 RepID=UPI001E5A015C|nr:UDP-glucose 4-epimerase GalE [Helicobacter anatolicus]MCE3037090.1 UDP-glucose 4-epimerase GalE [Helicobacter anatolicus]